MRFTEEDGIITAEEARERSSLGTDDSLVREAVRDVMTYVKRSSYYGFRSTTLILNYQIPSDLVRKEIEALGYTLEYKESYWQPRKDKIINYDWTIYW